MKPNPAPPQTASLLTGCGSGDLCMAGSRLVGGGLVDMIFSFMNDLSGTDALQCNRLYIRIYVPNYTERKPIAALFPINRFVSVT